MLPSVTIIGARGRFGRAAVSAFAAAGWRVKAFARTWPQTETAPAFETITGDAFDVASLTAACRGADVIVNALNSPYPRWQQDLPRLTGAIIAAATANGATILLPGNVYNYGEAMPPVLREETPHRPTTRKGSLRVDMEQTYRLAAGKGIRTIVLRAGDFIEREKTGNWFDSHIANRVSKGKATYPGQLDAVHAWAYLPDMARAMVELAGIRDSLENFDEFGFEGYSLTGAELLEAIEQASGQPLEVGSMPWRLLRVLALVSPLMREVLEMRYLWDVPHQIDGTRLYDVLPRFRPTPLDQCMQDVLGLRRRERIDLRPQTVS